MMQIIGTLITVASIAGLALIVEGATGFARWLSTWVGVRPRPQALPHAKPGTDDDEEDVCN